jgi:hypothetical protein
MHTLLQNSKISIHQKNALVYKFIINKILDCLEEKFGITIAKNILTFTYDFTLIAKYLPLSFEIMPFNITEIIFEKNLDVSNTILNTSILPIYKYENTITKIHLTGSFNCQIMPNVLPTSLKTLIVEGIYNQEFLPNVLPNGLENIILSDNYNQPFREGVLPQTLKYLYLGYAFNQNIFDRNILPDSLEKIIFVGHGLLQGQVNMLSEVLRKKKYELISKFNLPVLYLPSNLKELKFGANFRQNIYELPEKLEELEVPYYSSIKYCRSLGKLKKILIRDLTPDNNPINNIMMENISTERLEIQGFIHRNGRLSINSFPLGLTVLKLNSNYNAHANIINEIKKIIDVRIIIGDEIRRSTLPIH